MTDTTRLQITFTVDTTNVDQAMTNIMKSVSDLVTSPTFEARLLDSAEPGVPSSKPVDTRPPLPRRLRSCVEAWPDCEEGEYNPACCRFPKSCSCTIYNAETVKDEWLESPR
jgi:hypothetical protein